MEQKIEVVDVEATDAAVLPVRVAVRDVPMGIMPQFAKILELARTGAVPADARHVWLYRYREDGEVDAEIGVLTSTPVADREGLVATRTPSGSTAHAVHIGDFSKLRAVHAAIEAWCHDHGRERAGVTWEVYSDTDQPPEKRRCDVYHLLK